MQCTQTYAVMQNRAIARTETAVVSLAFAAKVLDERGVAAAKRQEMSTHVKNERKNATRAPNGGTATSMQAHNLLVSTKALQFLLNNRHQRQNKIPAKR